MRATQHDDPAERALILPSSIHRATDDDQPTRRRSSRRALLKLGGVAAAAGVAGVLLSEQSGTAHAAPAHADTMYGIHQTISGTGNIAIEGDGTGGAQGVVGTSDSSFGVLGTCDSGCGVLGISSTSLGVEGHSTNAAGVGGVSFSAAGVSGYSSTGVGGSFLGGTAPLYLSPSNSVGAPTTRSHFAGEIYPDSAATFWVCVASGTPGTWCQLTCVANGTPGGATNFLAVPIRLVDTRGNGAPITNGNSPLGANQTMTAQITGTVVTVNNVSYSVPASALALVGNLTALPFSAGDLTIYASGQPKPNVSNLNYNPGLNVANSVTVKLSSTGAADIFSNVGSCNVILDVTGYIL